MKLNSITAMWIGIRVERVGRAAKILTAAGFWREKSAALNNRSGCTYIRPCGSRAMEDFKLIFDRASAAGLKGIAFQWCDLQWKHNAGLTDAQWQARIEINPI
jgi:hypothetical protein